MNYKSRIASTKHEFYYHCVTRVVAGQHLFKDHEKAVFQSMMQKVADFCGVTVLTHCIMSNHIHILCRVPPSDFTDITDNELLRRYRILFSTPSKYRPFDPNVLESLLLSNSENGQQARKLLLQRMHNISMFMKILKLRFSIWFNKTHGRFGTLWAEKFKSIVVEGRGMPLLRMAQYIDLNPVRAGMTAVSTEYPFSGIAAARRGEPLARKGIEEITRLTYPTLPAQEAVPWYENHLRLNQPTLQHSAPKSIQRNPFDPPKSFMHRQKSLSNSLAMGSPDFLKILMKHFSECFSQSTHFYGPTRRKWALNENITFGRNKRSEDHN